MKKTSKKIWRNRFVTLTLAGIIIWLSCQFFVPALKLFVISDNIGYLTDYANWTLEDHIKYDELQADRKELAREGDIANWIVSSGSTSTGKIVRFAVLVGFAVADCFAIYLILAIARFSVIDCLRYFLCGGLAQSIMGFRTSIKRIQRQRRKKKFKKASEPFKNNRRVS